MSGTCTSPFLDAVKLKMALRARKVSGDIEKWAPTGLTVKLNFIMSKVTQPKQIEKTLAAQLALNEVSAINL